MPVPRNKADWPIVTALVAALVLGPLALYVAGYFATSESSNSTRLGVVNGIPEIEVRQNREFQRSWLRTFYWPAAKIEALIRGGELQEYDISAYEFAP